MDDQKRQKMLTLAALRRQYKDPYEIYNAFRAHGSVFFDTLSQCWIISDYTANTAILDDDRFSSELSNFSNNQAPALNFIQHLVSQQMLFLDGEQHRKMQRIILKCLSQMVKDLPHTIRAIAHEALAPAEQAGEMDIVNDFASSVSLLTIARVLGLPLDDREKMSQLEIWSDTFADMTSGYLNGDMQNINRLADYFRGVIQKKRHDPGDDLLSAFLQAEDVFADDDELISNCMMVFAAGRITTKKLLGNGIPLMLPHWERFQTQARSHPTFCKSLGEELLRLVTPTRGLVRQAIVDVDLPTLTSGTHLIRKGEHVHLFLEAANYDPAQFAHPMSLDVERRPNKHIAFGYGPHACPGAALARLEIQAALAEILSLPRFRQKPGTFPLWNPNPNLGGYTSYKAIFIHER